MNSSEKKEVSIVLRVLGLVIVFAAGGVGLGAVYQHDLLVQLDHFLEE